MSNIMKVKEKYPEKLTDEEQVLVQKFALMKKMKKQLAELRNRQATDADAAREKEETPRKAGSEEARVAAERLVKCGKIKISSATKSTIIMKKGKEAGEKSVPAYKPYSPTHSGASSSSMFGELQSESTMSADDSQQQQLSLTPQAKRPRVNLYENFVSAGSLADHSLTPSTPDASMTGDTPRRGNTVFVSGYGINQEMLRQAFTKFGSILKISMENKSRFHEFNPVPKAFITFEDADQAGKAIEDLDGQLVLGSVLNVKLARKQPHVPNRYHMQQQQQDDEALSDDIQQQQQKQQQQQQSDSAQDDDMPQEEAAEPQGSSSSQSQSYSPVKASAAAAAAPEASDTAASQEKQQQKQEAVASRRQQIQYSDELFAASDDDADDTVAELSEVM